MPNELELLHRAEGHLKEADKLLKVSIKHQVQGLAMLIAGSLFFIASAVLILLTR